MPNPLIWGCHRPLTRRPQVIARLSANFGVTPEHLLEVVRLRKRYRTARQDDAREMFGARNYRATRLDPVLHAGEGELHGWLRRLKMTTAEFCELAGMHRDTFNRWYGYCLWEWPVKMLALYAYARNMEKFLASKGYDLENFRDTPITKKMHQHYQIKKPSKLILEGLTDAERKQAYVDYGHRAAAARWKKPKPAEKTDVPTEPPEDFTPWKL
jgi:hypothetical protein